INKVWYGKIWFVVKSCSHKGVFYVQGDERHSLNFTEAEELCKVLGATLASAEQLNASHATGLEMCSSSTYSYLEI
uniref:Link domain-containing protein n=1 Tax=Astyanax mexicanus TaxID=7994 RepID=A0A3B1JEC0_ASTMX